MDAVRAGLGIARSADWTFAEAVREGRLVRLLPEWASTESPPLSLMYRPGAMRNASVRAVVEFCTTMMAEVGQRQLASVEASPPPAWLRGPSSGLRESPRGNCVGRSAVHRHRQPGQRIARPPAVQRKCRAS